MTDAEKLLGAILDHYQNNDTVPGEDWALDSEGESLCLDCLSPDGSKFWLDIERGGTIRVLWSPGNSGEVNLMTFVHQPSTPPIRQRSSPVHQAE